jgi:hypothetical protein
VTKVDLTVNETILTCTGLNSLEMANLNTMSSYHKKKKSDWDWSYSSSLADILPQDSSMAKLEIKVFFYTAISKSFVHAWVTYWHGCRYGVGTVLPYLWLKLGLKIKGWLKLALWLQWMKRTTEPGEMQEQSKTIPRGCINGLREIEKTTWGSFSRDDFLFEGFYANFNM